MIQTNLVYLDTSFIIEAYESTHGCPVLTTTVAIGWDRHLHNFRRCYLQVVDQ